MISQEQVSNVCTVLPDSCAQQVVIDYLNRKISDLDTTIGKIQSQIQKLKQAKQSLISEAVTGKIDLRDWEIMEVGEVQ